MSSSPTVPISTTVSLGSCRSRSEAARDKSAGSRPLGAPDIPATGQRTAVIACGALGAQLRRIIRRRELDVELHCLPPLLHNHPERISDEVDRLARRLGASHDRVAVAYADCGTYGALDEVCERLQLPRLAGLHCYDVLAGPEQISRLFAEEPGTYLLTDFLVSSFRRTVLAELGLDRRPELWADYFGHYRRLVWLAGEPTAELTAEADAISEMFGLPLSVIATGSSALEVALDGLLGAAAAGAAGPRSAPDASGGGAAAISAPEAGSM